MAALRRLLAAPPVRRWLAAAVLGRLALCMAPIAMLVIGDDVLGSVAAGARLAGLLTIATALCAPLAGRWMDSHGIVRGLRWAGWLSAAAALALSAALLGSPSMLALGTLAVALGAALAPMPAAYRALLPGLVARGRLAAASNLDAVTLEAALIAGPGLVAGLLLLPANRVAIVLAGVSAIAGMSAVTVAALPERSVPPTARASAGWRHPVLFGVLVVALLLGASGGLLEAAVFAEADRRDVPSAAAPGALTLLGLGSALGGLVATLRPPPANALTGGVLLTLYGAGTLLAAVSYPLWLVAACLFAAGMPVAPVNSVGALVLERHVPVSRHSTSFALAAGVLTLGTGLGQMLGGAAIDAAGAHAAFVGAALLPLAVGGAMTATGVHRRQW